MVAGVLRLVAAVGITLFSGYLFPDESEYVVLGRLAASGHLTPTFWSGYGETLFHSAASFMWPIVVLFKLFGAHRVVAALWAGLFGAVTAALTAVIVGRALGRTWSAIAGLTVAFFPSQILWSSVVLRESMVWAGLAGAAVGISIFSRAKRWQSLVGATLMVGVCLLSSRILTLLDVPASRMGNGTGSLALPSGPSSSHADLVRPTVPSRPIGLRPRYCGQQLRSAPRRRTRLRAQRAR